MKAIVALLTGLIFPLATTHAYPVSKLAAEWFVPLSTSPKNFALVDECSGAVRIATVDANGKVTWPHTISTGITGVTGVTGGLSGSRGEIVALTAPDANRVGMIDVDAVSPYLRILPVLTGVGPSGLSAIGAVPERELLVASVYNCPNTGRLEAHNDLSASGCQVAGANFDNHFRRLQTLSAPGSASAITLSTETSGTNTLIHLIDRAMIADIQFGTGASFPGSVEFATDIRSTYQPGKVFAVGYCKDSNLAYLLEIATPLNRLSAITESTPLFPFPVSAIIPIHEVAGPLTDGMIVISSDATKADWLRLNATGDGFEKAVPLATAEAGKFLTGMVPVPGIGFVKLLGISASGPSVSFIAYKWNGSDWTIASQGYLSELPADGLSHATLLFYDLDPAINDSARLLGIQSAGDWTRRAVIPDALPASVITEIFGNSATGLAVHGSQAVSAPALARYVMTNQVEPSVSITALGGYASLMTPDLRVDPASGSYDRSFQVTALFDDSRYELLWREVNGHSWNVWNGPLPVAWSTTLQFTLRLTSNHTLGPIQTRAYILSPAALATLDSDNDGVPDYVELAQGLDPFGGADYDGDGVSDLAEILAGTNPGEHNDFPDSAIDIGTNGMCIVAAAKNHSGIEMAAGEEMFAHSMTGSLLASAPSDNFQPVLPNDGGSRGAILRSAAAPPYTELIAVSTPLYFSTDGGIRSGLEAIRYVPSDPPPTFAPNYTPSGNDLSANAAAWVAKAKATSHPLANARTEVTPQDSAIAVLLEQLVHTALAGARPAENPAAALEKFTLFAARYADRTRQCLNAPDLAILHAAGFDCRRALDLSKANRYMTPLANGIYLHHYQNANTIPNMMLPIDALRIVLRGGDYPAGYANSAPTPAGLSYARDAYNDAITQMNQCYRPYGTWTIEIAATSAGAGVYTRILDEGTTVPVVLQNAAGERFLLEQGLGLRPGTRFSVTGFTDTPSAGSYPTMEITGTLLIFVPTSSDTDVDGNLLDDEWERFFFGATGNNAFSQPYGGNVSLLQYFLDGTDPRSTVSPSGPAVSLAPQAPLITQAAGRTYTVDFLFPAAYQDRFIFVVESSTTLGANSFQPVPGVTTTSIGGDERRATIPAAAATAASCCYRIRISLR